MTMQQLRDEFYQLHNDDAIFAGLYEATSDGFQAWLDDYQLGSDD